MSSKRMLSNMILILIGGCLLLIFLSSCTARITKANDGLFESPAMFVEKVGQLKPGMSEQEFYEALGVKPTVENLEFLKPEEIWPYVYGNTQPLVQLSQLIKAKENIMAPFKGIRLPYLFVQTKVGPAMGLGITLDQKGYNLKVVAIFENGKLFRSPHEGTAGINTINEIFIWDMLESGLRGGIMQGAREGVKVGIP